MAAIEQLLLSFIAGVYDAIGWPGVVLLMGIESASIPLPSELIMPLAGWMLIQAKGQPMSYLLLAGLYGALGNLLGSLIAYAVGAWGGRPLLHRYGRYFLITRSELDRADAWFAKYGDWAIFLSRLLPVVRTFISFPAGVVRMPILRFSILTFLGSFPWSLALAYGGYVLGDNWEALRHAMRPFDIPIIIALIALVCFYVYRRVQHLRREARELAEQSK